MKADISEIGKALLKKKNVNPVLAETYLVEQIDHVVGQLYADFMNLSEQIDVILSASMSMASSLSARDRIEIMRLRHNASAISKIKSSWHLDNVKEEDCFIYVCKEGEIDISTEMESNLPGFEKTNVTSIHSYIEKNYRHK